jgi:hypothetical protein
MLFCWVNEEFSMKQLLLIANLIFLSQISYGNNPVKKKAPNKEKDIIEFAEEITVYARRGENVNGLKLSPMHPVILKNRMIKCSTIEKLENGRTIADSEMYAFSKIRKKAAPKGIFSYEILGKGNSVQLKVACQVDLIKDGKIQENVDAGALTNNEIKLYLIANHKESAAEVLQEFGRKIDRGIIRHPKAIIIAEDQKSQEPLSSDTTVQNKEKAIVVPSNLIKNTSFR